MYNYPLVERQLEAGAQLLDDNLPSNRVLVIFSQYLEGST